MFPLYCPCNNIQSQRTISWWNRTPCSSDVKLPCCPWICEDECQGYGLSASHFGIILYESLNQLHIVFSLVISQEAMNNCNETVPSHFLRPVQQIGELVTFYELLDLRFDKDTSLDLCFGQLWRNILEVLKSCGLLVHSSVTNCLVRPNLMCRGGIRTFWGSITAQPWLSWLLSLIDR